MDGINNRIDGTNIRIDETNREIRLIKSDYIDRMGAIQSDFIIQSDESINKIGSNTK